MYKIFDYIIKLTIYNITGMKYRIYQIIQYDFIYNDS
jgi:hypothetical protein